MSAGNGSGGEILEGDGKVEMGIYHDNGQVIQRFQKPMLWIGYDPSNAVAVAKELLDQAARAGANIEIQIPRQPTSPEKRNRMVQRAGHMIHSMSQKGRPVALIAQQVVDTFLSDNE